MNKLFRHGDLSFHSTELETKGLEELKHSSSFVLAEGETTGHRHLITAEKESTVNVYKTAEGKMVLVINGTAILTHEEHKPLTFGTGTYVVEREREYNYFENEVQRVQD